MMQTMIFPAQMTIPPALITVLLLSKHALGMAIDINPFYNPYVTYPDGKERISPAGSEVYADRSNDNPHMIRKGDLCYQLFIDHGFTWGGEWKSLKDYQHFQKVIN